MRILFESAEAQERYNNLFLKPSWKNGWRIMLSQEVMNDWGHLPITIFHQHTYKDFDTDSTIFYPFGISQAVAIKRWIWFKSYRWLKRLGESQRAYESAIRRKGMEDGADRAKLEIEQEKKAAFRKGREFEFFTMNSHIEAMYRAGAKDDTKAMLQIFQETLKLLHERNLRTEV